MKITTQFLLPFCLHFASYVSASPVKNIAAEVGHHVIFSYPGLEPPGHLFNLIRQGKVGGIILFGENISDNLTITIDKLQQTYKESPHYSGRPLFIMTDQEGGQIRRFAGGPEQSAKQVGQAQDLEKAATLMGRDAASTLIASKVNFNLAPVLGVFRQEGDFLDNRERSFSNSSKVVATCASAFIHAQQAEGVIASAKHFPGLGAAGKDANTDEQPVVIDLTAQELQSVDMAPYAGAIEAGVDMVMTSWAVYPALDPHYPSGLSRSIIQGELRDRLGFRGVTITDALEAGALEAFGDDSARGLVAAEAGMDLLLASARNVTQGEDVYNALLGALVDGSMDKALFDDATDRILDVRRKLLN